MKLVITTKNGPTRTHRAHYVVRLPNYFNTDNLSTLLSDIKVNYLIGERILTHQLMGDESLTLPERKQLDTEGEVISPPIELDCARLVKQYA